MIFNIPQVMSWENTFMTAYLLPSRISHSNGSIDTSSRFLEEGGQLALLVILSTAAALAVALLLFILIRIACIRKTACFKSYRNKKKQKQKNCRGQRQQQQQSKNGEWRDRSSPAVSDIVVVGPFHCSDSERPAVEGGGGAVQEIPTSFSRDALHQEATDANVNSYVIKLVDNDLIVETQEMKRIDDQCDETIDNGDSDGIGHVSKDQDGFSAGVFKSWLESNHTEWDSQSMQLETKTLDGSPAKAPSVGAPLTCETDAQVEAASAASAPISTLATVFATAAEKRSVDGASDRLTSFGLSQSQSLTASQEEDVGRYSYRNSNQVEYMGGTFFPYIDPMFASHHQIRRPIQSPTQVLAKGRHPPGVR